MGHVAGFGAAVRGETPAESILFCDDRRCNRRNSSYLRSANVWPAFTRTGLMKSSGRLRSRSSPWRYEKLPYGVKKPALMRRVHRSLLRIPECVPFECSGLIDHRGIRVRSRAECRELSGEKVLEIVVEVRGRGYETIRAVSRRSVKS